MFRFADRIISNQGNKLYLLTQTHIPTINCDCNKFYNVVNVKATNGKCGGFAVVDFR